MKKVNLSFDNGFQEVSVNGKAICFNPNDSNIITRINQMYKNIEEKEKEVNKIGDIDLTNDGLALMSQMSEIVDDLSNFINDQIDFMFNSKVAEVVFEGQSPLSMVGGKPLYLRFLECIVPYIISEVETNSKKKVDKYVKQVK